MTERTIAAGMAHHVGRGGVYDRVPHEVSSSGSEVNAGIIDDDGGDNDGDELSRGSLPARRLEHETEERLEEEEEEADAEGVVIPLIHRTNSSRPHPGSRGGGGGDGDGGTDGHVRHRPVTAVDGSGEGGGGGGGVDEEMQQNGGVGREDIPPPPPPPLPVSPPAQGYPSSSKASFVGGKVASWRNALLPTTVSTAVSSCGGLLFQDRFVQRTRAVVSVFARLVLWGSIVATVAAIAWYSLELLHNGTDTHLIAWFSAGAFVILGFPISIYGIFMHLTHYYQPNIQCYIVRILWMVPIYSVESWLCLRFNKYAIYIETLRDCYEAYVLYSFLQFLINVLGGEEELVLLLKDKSPTRGCHMRPLNWCIKPWLMGQPVMRQGGNVQWTSPFYVKCKFGVLQYVLLKNITAIATMILEMNGLYSEGDFSPKSGYLYICIVTNTSQCWALYCLAFFYYATKNELSPIRPVGKFLSVKSLVFFTWWQSLFIAIFDYYQMIPTYKNELFDLSEEDVGKMIQSYLICIEMFMAALVHYFVFPHTEYSDNKDAALSSRPQPRGRRLSTRHHRLGRNRGRRGRQRKNVHGDDDRMNGESSFVSERVTLLGESEEGLDAHDQMTVGGVSDGDRRMLPLEISGGRGYHADGSKDPNERDNSVSAGMGTSSTAGAVGERGGGTVLYPRDGGNGTKDDHQSSSAPPSRRSPTQGFVSAFLDSTLPRDVMDHSAGIVKGEYIVHKKTLLHHAATSDEYDLFVSNPHGAGIGRPKALLAKQRGDAAAASKDITDGGNSGTAAPSMSPRQMQGQRRRQQQHLEQKDQEGRDGAPSSSSSATDSLTNGKGKRGSPKKATYTQRLWAGLNSSADAVSMAPMEYR